MVSFQVLLLIQFAHSLPKVYSFLFPNALSNIVHVIRMQFLRVRREINSGKITASFSCIVCSLSLRGNKAAGLFYCFSGLVEVVARTSLLDDLSSLLDSGAVKSESELTLPAYATLDRSFQVRYKRTFTFALFICKGGIKPSRGYEICEKVIMQLVRN